MTAIAGQDNCYRKAARGLSEHERQKSRDKTTNTITAGEQEEQVHPAQDIEDRYPG
jgi:hypothetical protein